MIIPSYIDLNYYLDQVKKELGDPKRSDICETVIQELGFIKPLLLRDILSKSSEHKECSDYEIKPEIITTVDLNYPYDLDMRYKDLPKVDIGTICRENVEIYVNITGTKKESTKTLFKILATMMPVGTMGNEKDVTALMEKILSCIIQII
jgi:hypothetical protein